MAKGDLNNFTQAVENLLAGETSTLDPAATAGPNKSALNLGYKTLYSDDAMQHGDGRITTDYVSSVSYYRIEGRSVYPVAGTDGTGNQAGLVVQEQCPIEFATISWMAIATGAMPRVPSPNLADTNFILIDRSVGNAVPVIGVGGGIRRFAVSGTYHYQMVRPGAVIRDFPGLGNTMDATARTANTLPATKFDSSLVF